MSEIKYNLEIDYTNYSSDAIFISNYAFYSYSISTGSYSRINLFLKTKLEKVDES